MQKVCKACGGANEETSRFCVHCGAALEQPEQVNQQKIANDNKLKNQETVSGQAAASGQAVASEQTAASGQTVASGQTAAAGQTAPKKSFGQKFLHYYFRYRRICMMVAGVIALIALLMRIFGPGYVSDVKDMYFRDYSKTVTIGTAIEQAFSDDLFEKKWSEEKVGNRTYVVFEAKGKKTSDDWKIYFHITESKKMIYAEVEKVARNGEISRNSIIIAGVLHAIYNNDIRDMTWEE